MPAQHGDPGGIVVAHAASGEEQGTEHERQTLLGFVRQLAALRGDRPDGFARPAGAQRVYFVPTGTLTREQAEALGIRGPDDLFGGVVPHGFVATKAISHPLLHAAAAAPPGWNPRLAEQVADSVLEGYTVFDPVDAQGPSEPREES